MTLKGSRSCLHHRVLNIFDHLEQLLRFVIGSSGGGEGHPLKLMEVELGQRLLEHHT